MNEQYHNEEDSYDDEYYDHDYGHKYDPYKFYFKFDISNSPMSDWMQKFIDDLISNPFGTDNVTGFPVKDLNPIYGGESKAPLYIGNNLYKEPIWKTKYFVCDKINITYKNHIKSNAVHFLKQPTYYKGLFDILN